MAEMKLPTVPLTLNYAPEYASLGDADDHCRFLLSVEVPQPPPDAHPHPHPPLDLVLVLDNSGSMRAHAQTLRQVLDFILTTLSTRENARVAVVTFAAGARVCLELTQASQVTLEQREELAREVSPHGPTDLAGGLQGGLDELGPSSDGRSRSVIVVSDGRATAGETEPGAIRARVISHAHLEQAAVHFCTIGDDCAFALLRSLARGSAGGTLQEIPRHASPAATLGTMFGLALHQQAGDVTVEVELPPGAERSSRGVALRAHEAQANEVQAVGDGKLVFSLGNLASGEVRSVCVTLEHCRGVAAVGVRVRYVDNCAGLGERVWVVPQEGRWVPLTYSSPKRGTQNLVVTAACTVLDTVALMQQLATNPEPRVWLKSVLRKLRWLSGELQTCGSPGVERAAEQLQRLGERAQLLLRALENNQPLQVARLERSITSEFAVQRASSYEAVDGSAGMTAPPLPLLVRQVSHGTVVASSVLGDGGGVGSDEEEKEEEEEGGEFPPLPLPVELERGVPCFDPLGLVDLRFSPPSAF